MKKSVMCVFLCVMCVCTFILPIAALGTVETEAISSHSSETHYFTFDSNVYENVYTYNASSYCYHTIWYKKYVCSCGDVYMENMGKMNASEVGHQWNIATVDPATGVEHGSCRRCGVTK